MMPLPLRRRNSPPRPGRAAVAWAALCSCAGPIDVELRLDSALDPDPFTRVARVRVVGLVRGEPRTLDEVRWDQGPVDLGRRLPIEAERVWVEGLDADGRLVSAALGPPVDLLSDAPERLDLLFARVGALSVAPGRVPPRRGWRATSFGEAGVLLLAGEAPDGTLPTETLVIGPRGEVERGPDLPEGRHGPAIAWTPRGVAIFGGRTTSGPASTWLRLRPGRASAEAPNPIPPGVEPVALGGGDERYVIAVDPPFRRVAQLDLESMTGREEALPLDASATGAAFARLDAASILVIGGRNLPSAVVYDPSSSSVRRSVPLPHPFVDAAAAQTSALSTVVVAGIPSRPGSFGASTIRFPFGRAVETGTVARFAVAAGDAPTRLYDTGAGLLLAASSTPTAPAWSLRLLDARLTRLDPLGSAFDLARHPDGTLRGVADDGRLLVFSPGPGVFAPSTGPQGGLVPRTPETWSVEGDAVVGRAPDASLPGEIRPETWVGLGDRIYDEFRLELRVTPIGRGSAAVLVDLGASGFEIVALQRSARVRSTRDPSPVACPVADVAALDEGAGAYALRVTRSRGVLGVDVGADGVVEIECPWPARGRGRLGLAVLRGTVRFSDLRVVGALPSR